MTQVRSIRTAVAQAIGALLGGGVAEVGERPALRDAADRTVLLVVGSRGHGGFAEALLGSLSQHYGRANFYRLWGGIIQDSAYGAVWGEARKQALTPRSASPLGCCPHNLRHATVSLWLNSRLTVTSVPERRSRLIAIPLCGWRSLTWASPTPGCGCRLREVIQGLPGAGDAFGVPGDGGVGFEQS
jgi:hypothetical protein